MLTGADLVVRREALGLSQSWVAQQVGVQERTACHWEAGELTIPADVEILLGRIEEQTEELMLSCLEAFQGIVAGVEHDPDGVDVAAYATDEQLWLVHPGFAPLPASWHRAMLAKVRESIDAPVVFRFPVLEP